MLVSHTANFIYLKTHKTAGTSVEAFLEQFCTDRKLSLCHSREAHISEAGIVSSRWGGGGCLHEHMSPHAVKSLVKEKWYSYYKFCCIRNPFDRMVSLYFWTEQPEQFQRPWKFQIADPIPYKHEEGLDVHRRRFEECLFRACHESGNNPWSRDWIEQRLFNQYFVNGKFCLDDTVRYENMKSDLSRICNHLHLPQCEIKLPQFKRNVRPGWASVENMYTTKSKSLVEKLCRAEMDGFGYSFKSSLKML